MITGDKQETAINIAIACKLVHHIKDLLIVNAHQSEEAAQARLQDLLALCKASNPGATRGTVSVKAGPNPLPCATLPPLVAGLGTGDRSAGCNCFPLEAHASGSSRPGCLCQSPFAGM